MTESDDPHVERFRPRRRGLWVVIGCLLVGLVVADTAVRRHIERREAPGPWPTPAAMTRPHNFGEYFVGGYAERPGAYRMNGPQTLRGALAAAGVREDLGARSFVTISRTGPGGFEIIKVELYPLLRDGKSDEALRADDRIYVQDAK